jgi:hypothetical protein
MKKFEKLFSTSFGKDLCFAQIAKRYSGKGE